MKLRNIAFSMLAVAGVGIGGYCALPIVSLFMQASELTGPRSYRMPDGALISCTGKKSSDPVSYITHSTDDRGYTLTTIVAENDGQPTVVAIAANKGEFIYAHWANSTNTKASPVLARGVYDAGNDRYKVKSIDPGTRVPSVPEWRTQWQDARAFCTSPVANYPGATFIDYVGAYPADGLAVIDQDLSELISFRSAVSKSKAIKYLKLREYRIDALPIIPPASPHL